MHLEGMCTLSLSSVMFHICQIKFVNPTIQTDLIFTDVCLILSLSERGVLNFPIKFAYLSISAFSSLKIYYGTICLTCFKV